MAQSRARRNERRRRRADRTPAAPRVDTRRRNLRRVVIAFLVLIGLAGILAVTAPGGDPSGTPHVVGSTGVGPEMSPVG